VQIKTDKRGWQTRFNLKRRNSDNDYKKTILVGKQLKVKKINKFYVCVNLNRYCYKLTVIDKGEDGITNGYVRLFRNDKRIFDDEFNDGKKLIKRIGSTCKLE